MEKIGVFAKRNGVSTRTLHYYDEIGLLVPERSKGVRLYSNEDATILKRILVLKDLGFSLDDVARFLHDFIPFATVISHRADLIAMRDELNGVISKIDSFHLDQTLSSFDNPIGISIRKIMGDAHINKVYDTHEIDVDAYTIRLDAIMLKLKQGCVNETKLREAIRRYYAYFIDDLHLAISKPDFERIVSDNIAGLHDFEEHEKRILLRGIHDFVLS